MGGVRKAALRIGGITLLERVRTQLGPVAAPVLISTGPGERWLAERSDTRAVADLAAPVGGPLAGLAAAVAWLRAQGIMRGLLVSVAVDTPFLPGDFVDRLNDAMTEVPAAYAAWGTQFYPPNALWRLEALAQLPAEVAEDRAPRSLKALHQALGSRQVDWAGQCAADPFANLNTLADLVMLGRRARP